MKRIKERIRKRKLEVMLEFFIFGVIFGVVEDVLAVKIVTGETITWEVVGIVVLIAFPFAVIGEVVVDNINLVKGLSRIWKKKSGAG